MPTVLPILFILVVAVGLMLCSYIFVPKGQHQTLLRSSLMLTVAACYLMWAITYLAQLHPLISPQVTYTDE
ncbi:ATPase, V0 complex, subunit E [Athelia psychrophila]|uniref:ATPase, V0 complex, subunit E n=1 Tax=Athelia psychrophila TaxID=1759441 RepID=A0A166LBX0_9AGAM|nr:ATPase, V0 complex, subunit E [Fibularhizoctonia sp. CBS 109695]